MKTYNHIAWFYDILDLHFEYGRYKPLRRVLFDGLNGTLLDAGVGTASDATIAMELGCDGVLINTAIAEAKNPVLMAEAMKHAVISGRKAFRAGRMKKREYGSASSPTQNLINN